MTAATHISRREFVTDVGLLASSVPLAACAAHSPAQSPAPQNRQGPSADWDLSWIQHLAPATDRAVFDWVSLGGAEDPIVLDLATRYLDNCSVAYAPGTYRAVAVMNIRTSAIAAAMTDAAWARHALGVEYKVTDPATQATAVRNPFWSRGSQRPAGGSVPATLEAIVQRGGIILVCDFAMGHLASRLAAKTGATANDVHQDLRHSLVPGAYAVPSGIFGMARAQNAGCALVKL
jgi:hypothetical protein